MVKCAFPARNGIVMAMYGRMRGQENSQRPRRLKKPASMRQIGGSIRDLLDPLMAKRANVDLSLALAWQQVAGEKLHGRTQPLHIQWPQRLSPDDQFKPGTLVVAAEGSVALDLQYTSGELIERINRFFGYPAVSKIRIEQKPVMRFREKQKRVEPVLMPEERAGLEASLSGIEDEGLRDDAVPAGAHVMAARK